MTLCIASKSANIISLASDSRITFGEQNYGPKIDFGIKTFSVPVKIYPLGDTNSRNNNLVYEHDIGMCVSGNAINAYIVKESIYEILQHLQLIPGYTDFSMDGICKLISKVYEKVSRDICAIHVAKGFSKFFIGGYCPYKKKIRLFKFYTLCEGDRIVSRFDEILQNDGMEFIGSGANSAKKVKETNPYMNSFYILREVIKDEEQPKVGGDIQYGEFKENNFKIFGIKNYEYEEGSLELKYKLRGIDLYGDRFNAEFDDFHINYNFKLPFEREINNLAE